MRSGLNTPALELAEEKRWTENFPLLIADSILPCYNKIYRLSQTRASQPDHNYLARRRNDACAFCPPQAEGGILKNGLCVL